MRLPGQPAIGLANLNENMYLVVRSLKNNNEKTVSKNIWLNRFRTTRSKKRIFWRLGELNLQWKRSDTQILPPKWTSTRFQPKKKSAVTAPTVSSINQTTNSLKSLRRLNSLSWPTTQPTRTLKTSAGSVGNLMLLQRTPFLNVVDVQDPSDQSIWNVCSSGCPPNASQRSCQTSVRSFGRHLSAKSAKRHTR